MNDSPRTPSTGDRPATPRWVKALGIAIVVAVVLVVVLMVLSGGEHGPGNHTGTMAFDPLSFQVAAGEPVTFVVTNADGAGMRGQIAVS